MAYDPVAIWKEGRKRRRQAARLRAKGHTLDEIGKVMGISHQRVSKLLGGAKRGNGAA